MVKKIPTARDNQKLQQIQQETNFPKTLFFVKT
jgi:hypothetical protein